MVPAGSWYVKMPPRKPVGQWLVENMPRGIEFELPDRRESEREIPFAGQTDE